MEQEDLMQSKPNLLVKYQFKGDTSFQEVWLTRFQYENFKELDVIDVCEIISSYEDSASSKHNLKKLISQ